MPDREKVIKGLECCQCTDYIGRQCPYWHDVVDDALTGCDCTTELVRDALALLKEQAWHLLTEDADGIIHGLPGDDGQYLMTDGEDIWIDDYVDGVDDGVWLDSGRDIREIKAWMYMPELPKQEGR